MRSRFFEAAFITLVLAVCVITQVNADSSSTNFIIKDPVIKPGGGFASSTNFNLFGILGQPAVGTSTGTTFGLKAGFLFFVSPPKAPGALDVSSISSSQLNLSWTDNSTDEDGFWIERKIGAGGTYAQIATSSANATSYSDTGLSAATTYFYRMRAFNISGGSSYTADVGGTTGSVTPPPSGGGGGGGGGGGPPGAAGAVVLIGKAYPQSQVTVLVDGTIKGNQNTDAQATFNIHLNVDSGIHSFSIYSTDSRGRRSLTYTFTLAINGSQTSTVSGIFLAPTIEVDKSEVKKGDVLNILGQTAPQSSVTIFVNSEHEIIKEVPTQSDGTYFLAFNTTPLEYGDHSTKSQSKLVDATISAFSQTINFKVGDKTIQKFLPGDLNKNGRVNIVDFSMLLFWWNKTDAQGLEVADINKDGRVNLTDLSIQLYYWTG